MASFKAFIKVFIGLAILVASAQSARREHKRHGQLKIQHYKSMVKTYADMIDATIDMARPDDEVKQTIPYSNEDIELLVKSLPDVIDDEACLGSESCAVSWMSDYNRLLDKITERGAVLEFAFETNITESNENELNVYSAIENKFELLTKPILKKFLKNCKHWNAPLRRMLHLASQGIMFSEADSLKISTISNTLESLFAKAKVADPNNPSKLLSLDPDLSDIMAKSRNYSQLLWAWKSWRDATGPKMRAAYAQSVALKNKGARENGYRDLSEQWIEDFEEPDFESTMDKLFEEIKPFYELLHAYVRRILNKQYESSYDKSEHNPDLIQAHLLGNMWAQGWENIYDLVKPFPSVEDLDLDKYLVEQKYTPRRIFTEAERFFNSMGLFKMTPTFWENSMIEKPENRSVVCHASASDFNNGFDYRIKMCTQVDDEDFYVVHHEMGHIEYYMAYRHQPAIFRTGANSAFHEAIGDTIALSVMTPKHLKTVNIIESDKTSQEQDLNFLMKMALKNVAFLPFGYLMDKWRWRVFKGEIDETNYNSKWWEMRTRYQGLEPPVPRDESDFDPASKYHIASYTPYSRYFISHFHQFQFYKALCSLSGHEGPLHKCDFYNSKEAGAKLKEMLSLGASHHWTYALNLLTGEKKISAQAIFEYFEPLIKWLKRVNQKNNEKPGW